MHINKNNFLWTQNEKMRRRDAVPLQRRRGKATPPKGGKQRNPEGEKRTAAHPKERGGQVAPSKREEEWGATHSKDEEKSSAKKAQGKAAPAKESCVSPSLGWCCFPSLFG